MAPQKKPMTPAERRIMAPFGKVKLTIEYDGSNYCGWQRQGGSLPSIQGKIEEALFKVFKVRLSLIAAGRTDAGVHAENQVAHFIAPREVSTFKFVQMFPSFLPADIVIKKAELVSADFHSQRSSRGKTYVYRVWNEPLASALRSRYSLWIRKPLDLDRLNRACQHLLGTHDFNCFRSEGSAVRSTVRTIRSAKVLKKGDYVEFVVTGDGFLKQMVRNIVGTLIQIELNNRDPESLPALIASKDRKQAGPTVQPQGLYLSEVFYDPELDFGSRPL
jgi:tRNA pseudouridine38-40 synthase